MGFISDASFMPLVSPEGDCNIDIHVQPDCYPAYRSLRVRPVSLCFQTEPSQHQTIEANIRNARAVLVDFPDSREAAKLITLYDLLAPRLRPKDKLIYLGNVIGRINGARETVYNLLRFRSQHLSIPGNYVNVYNVMRGHHEQMPHKLLRLQFAIDPREVLR